MQTNRLTYTELENENRPTSHEEAVSLITERSTTVFGYYIHDLYILCMYEINQPVHYRKKIT